MAKKKLPDSPRPEWPEHPTFLPSSVDAYLDLLGMTGRDVVTGLTGIVTSIGFDLMGCVQMVLAPPVDKDGKLPDGRWLDANRVEITDRKRVMPLPVYAKTPETHRKGPADKPSGMRNG